MPTDSPGESTTLLLRYTSTRLPDGALMLRPQPLEAWCSVKQASKDLGFSCEWVQAQCRSGLLEAVQPGGRKWRIKVESVRRLLDAEKKPVF